VLDHISVNRILQGLQAHVHCRGLPAGDENRKMLQRIYGTAFADKKELDAYLARLEEAKRRDHRKLGRELTSFFLMKSEPGW
jgi:threonyl-tRNA synthetase